MRHISVPWLGYGFWWPCANGTLQSTWFLYYTDVFEYFTSAVKCTCAVSDLCVIVSILFRCKCRFCDHLSWKTFNIGRWSGWQLGCQFGSKTVCFTVFCWLWGFVFTSWWRFCCQDTFLWSGLQRWSPKGLEATWGQTMVSLALVRNVTFLFLILNPKP